MIANNTLEFSSQLSNYKILLNSTDRFGYMYWKSRCEGELFNNFCHKYNFLQNYIKTIFSGLGDGWAPVIFNSEEELAFVKAIHEDFNEIHSYWVGGFTDSELNSNVEYSNYYSDAGGNHMC